MSAVAATADPVKKRGRPRKVVLEAAESEGASTAKSRKKKDVVGGREVVEEVVAKKKAKSVKEGKTVAKSASASAGAKTTTTTTTATTTTKAAGVKSKVEKEREKGGATAKPAKGVLEEGAAAKMRVAAQTPTPGATSSPILEKVFLTETMKRPAWGVRASPGAAGKAAATVAAATVTAVPTPKSLPASHPSTSAPKPASPIVRTTPPTPAIAAAATTKPTTTPTTPSTPSAPSPPTPSASAPPPPLSKHTPPPRITTIPLPPPPPPRAANPASTKPPPKPPTPQEIAQEAVEQVIRTGKLPDKYKPASRRITAIMVGIPIILVYGWYFVDKWKQEMHDRYPDRFPAPKKKEPPVVKVVSY